MRAFSAVCSGYVDFVAQGFSIVSPLAVGFCDCLLNARQNSLQVRGILLKSKNVAGPLFTEVPRDFGARWWAVWVSRSYPDGSSYRLAPLPP